MSQFHPDGVQVRKIRTPQSLALTRYGEGYTRSVSPTVAVFTATTVYGALASLSIIKGRASAAGDTKAVTALDHIGAKLDKLAAAERENERELVEVSERLG